MPQPVQFDFQALADGVVRNNVGVDRITVAFRGHCDGGEVLVAGTGQRLPASATAETTASQPWLWCAVEGYGEDEQVTLRCTGATAGPTVRPQVLPAAR